MKLNIALTPFSLSFWYLIQNSIDVSLMFSIDFINENNALHFNIIWKIIN